MRLMPPSSPSVATDLRCRLPGAMQGAAYDARIEPPPGYQVMALAVPVESGLRVVAQATPPRLTGTVLAKQPVPVTITLQNLATRAQVTVETHISVVASTQSLFNDIPPDPRAPGAKPPQTALALPWRKGGIAGASVRGRAHANTGGQREDDFEIAVIDPATLAFALSDGAGSARLSALASALAVRASIETVSSCLATGSDLEAAVIAAATAAHQRLLAAAAAEGCGLDDLGCTLIIGLYRAAPTAGADATLVLWQIGDGVVFTQANPGAAIAVLIGGDHGEYAGQTHFLHHLQPQPELFQRRLKRCAIAAGQWLAACTDGISDPFNLDLETDAGTLNDLSGRQPVVEMLKAAQQAILDPAQTEPLLAAISVFTPAEHDDRSLVYLTPVAAP